MCLGESTTQRQYPPFLEEILNQRNIGIKFSVIDKGYTGISTSDILSTLPDYINEYKPNMIIAMMGINDSKHLLDYKIILTSKTTSFLSSFRIYKLLKLLWLHILIKFNKESPIQEIELNPKNTKNIHLGCLYASERYHKIYTVRLKNNPWVHPYTKKMFGCFIALEFIWKRISKSCLWEFMMPLLKHNYLKLKDITEEKRIKLVCMQYPMRSIKPLKELFRGHNDIVFIDNEMLFKNAVKEAGYNDIFTDSFAGDFGHCTNKGNRLLAENIADVILKEVFYK